MKRVLSLMIVLVLLCVALAEGDGERYCGAWAGDGFVLEIRYEEDSYHCRATRGDGEAEREVWVYETGWYDAEQCALVCAGGAYSRQRYDVFTDEYAEADWALDDLTPSVFALSEDGETLSVSGLIGLEETLTLNKCVAVTLQSSQGNSEGGSGYF